MRPISKKILLHIGAGKCGSSSIQKTLTFNPTFGYKGGGPGPVNYWLIQNGMAFKSPNVTSLAFGQDYLHSNHLIWRDLDRPCIHKCLKDLIAKMESHEVAIVSGEVIGHQIFKIVENARTFCDCSIDQNLEITALFFTRDIFTLVESGFYQWGLWSHTTLEKWIEKIISGVSNRHGAIAQSTLEFGCNNLVVYHLNQGNLLDPFFTILEGWGYLREQFTITELMRSNSRASLDDIRLQKRNEGLREIHKPRTEFFLEQIRSEGNLHYVKPPNLLTESNVSAIVSQFSEDRELLQMFCSEETKEILRREFSQEHMLSFDLRDPKNDPYETLREPPSIEYLERLSVLLINKIFAQQDSITAPEINLWERDQAIAERDQAIAERDQAIAEREMILNSRIWKYTKLWRKLR